MRSPAKTFVGFETFFNNARMALKMELYIFVILTLIVSVIGGYLYKKELSPSERSIIRAYYLSHVHSHNKKVDVLLGGHTYYVTYEYASKNYKNYAHTYLKRWSQKARWSLLVYILCIPANFAFALRARKQSESQFLRGAKLVSDKELNKLISKNRKKDPPYVPIGKIKMPQSAEVKHTLIVGRPGVGKTVLLSQILNAFLNRDSRMICHDFKGDYLQKFYRPDKDIIFNPLDERSVYWNFFDEIESPIDVDAVGYALIPDAKGAGMDPFWANAARDVFTGIINYLYRNDMRTYRDLHQICTSPSDLIADILKSTPGSEAGATTIADPESKQTGSIMSVMTQYTKIFAYMPDKEGDRFSIRQWLEDENAGNIFITNYSNLSDTLAPILGLMVDLFSRKLLSLPESHTRRIMFLLDEFGMLPKLQSIVPILTQGRSKGGGVYIGIQDLGQIEKIYGREHRQSLVNACGSSIVFSVADNDTSKVLSEKYGDFISIETYMTQSMGVANNRDGLSINQQKQKEALILPSEIINLPDLTCYVQFPGYPVAKTTLEWKAYKDLNEPFMMRKGLSYEELLQDEYNIRKATSFLTEPTSDTHEATTNEKQDTSFSVDDEDWNM